LPDVWRNLFLDFIPEIKITKFIACLMFGEIYFWSRNKFLQTSGNELVVPVFNIRALVTPTVGFSLKKHYSSPQEQHPEIVYVHVNP